MSAVLLSAEDEAPLGACEGPGADAARRAGQELDRLAGLWQSLRGALTAIDRAIKAASGERELGLAHWLLLLRLGRRGSMPQSELRQQAELDSGFLTRLLDELDARQLLQRTRSGADRRQVQLRITARGRAAVRAMLTTAGACGHFAPRRGDDAERLQQLAAGLFAPEPLA
jgi:DNA-binding MarR family transcriptional regulator